MTHFKYSETQLLEKPLPELRKIHRQVGAKWEIGDDQRKKANWIKSILNHQANIQEHHPEQSESRIFTEIDTDAQPGDYFRLPFKPIVQVLSRKFSDFKKNCLVFIVGTASGDRSEWEISLTTTPQPAPQQQPQPTPVDPLDKPFDQLTKEEWEQLKRYPNPDNSLRLEPADVGSFSVTQELPNVWLVREGAVLRGSYYRDSKGQYVADCGTYPSQLAATTAILEASQYQFEEYDEDSRGTGRILYKASYRYQFLGAVLHCKESDRDRYIIGDFQDYPTIYAAAAALRDWVQACSTSSAKAA